MLTKNQIYYRKNKEYCLALCEDWRERNKDRIKKRLAEKITCECGSIISKGSKSSHIKTQIHKERLPHRPFELSNCASEISIQNFFKKNEKDI